MHLIHLGVGEAFDERLGNNAHLLVSKTVVLLDCGYAVPHALWRYDDDRDLLDAVYLSHAHADHYFGLPALLGRMGEEGRTKKLTIITQKGVWDKAGQILEFGYPGLRQKYGFDLAFIEAKGEVTLNELSLRFAPCAHPVPDLAIRITDGKRVICYSGDGLPSKEAEELYRGADVLVQETYLLNEERQGHCSIRKAIEIAERVGIKTLLLSHIQRSCRRVLQAQIRKAMAAAEVEVLLPSPGDRI